MENLLELYHTMGVSPAVYAYGEAALARLKERFEAIDHVAEYNQAKVLWAMRKNRVSAGGEKIDIVVWSEDPCEYVRSALSPADVISVSLIPGQKACRVVVPDDQLSLAIGKEGQNARLAARLTGYKIDIKPASQAEEDSIDN